jgi:hypothetical protein
MFYFPEYISYNCPHESLCEPCVLCGRVLLLVELSRSQSEFSFWERETPERLHITSEELSKVDDLEHRGD